MSDRETVYKGQRCTTTALQQIDGRWEAFYSYPRDNSGRQFARVGEFDSEDAAHAAAGQQFNSMIDQQAGAGGSRH